MAKREHVKATCPFCAWCRRSFNLPEHLIGNHIDKIYIRPVTNNHCIFAYVLKAAAEMSFCVCLSCKKGQMNDGYDGNGSRWVELHAKKEECKKEHLVRLAELKEAIHIAATTTAVQKPEEQTSGSALTVWNQLKSKPDYKDLCAEFERDDKENHDEDSENEEEYMFDPAKGILKLFTDASAFKKKLYKVTASVNKIEARHKEKEGILFNKIIELEEIIANTKFTEIESYNRREMLKMELEDADKQLKPPVSIE